MLLWNGFVAVIRLAGFSGGIIGREELYWLASQNVNHLPTSPSFLFVRVTMQEFPQSVQVVVVDDGLIGIRKPLLVSLAQSVFMRFSR